MKNQNNSRLSDLNSQKHALSNTDDLFLIELQKKFFLEYQSLKTPTPPSWTLIFCTFIFIIKTLTFIKYYQEINLMGSK